MRHVLTALAVLAALGFLLSVFLEASFNVRSQKVQLVRSTTGMNLMGPPVEILDVPKEAIVEEGGNGVPPLVDADRLQASGPVVETATIRRFINLARAGCLLALLLIVVGGQVAKRLHRPPIDE